MKISAKVVFIALVGIVVVAAIAGGAYLFKRRAELAAAAPPPPSAAMEIAGVEKGEAGAEGCSIRPIGPLLKKTDYEKYEALREDEGATIHETVLLPANVALSLKTSGCEDFETIQFQFVAPKSAVPTAPKERLAWLRDSVANLLLMDGKIYVTRLETLLKKFDSLAAVDQDGFKKVEICNNTDAEPSSCADEQNPTCRNECDWESGGASQFLWEDSPGDTITVSFVYYTSA